MKRKTEEPPSESSDEDISSDSEMSIDQDSPMEDVQETNEESLETELHTTKKQKLNDGGVSRKQEEKQKKRDRQVGKSGGEMLQRAKKVWEDLRSKEIDRRNKVQLIDETLPGIKSSIQDLIFKHDASRIIQSMVKYGTKEHRKSIAQELNGKWVDLMQSKYGKFLALRMLHYSPEARTQMIKEVKGKVAKLMRHSEAANVVEEIFSRYSNAKQRHELLEEYYGPEFTLFKVRDPNQPHELSLFLQQKPEKKESIIKSLEEHVNAILSKPSTLTSLSLLHRVLYEFLKEADSETVAPHLALFPEHLIHIIHTKDGSGAARFVILRGDAKLRKQVLKTFKTFVTKVATDPVGYLVLMTIFESVDDTVTVGKAIIPELIKDAVTVAKDKNGSRVLLHLLTGRSQRYHSKELLQDLASTDELRKTTSKKDDDKRRQELKDATVKPLIEAFKGHALELIKNRWAHQVLVETIRAGGSEAKGLLQEIANGCVGKIDEKTKTDEPFHPVKKLAAEAQEEDEDSKHHALVNRWSSFAIKELLVLDKSTKNGFPQMVMTAIQPNVKYWVDYCVKDPIHTNGAAFVLVSLIEQPDDIALEARKLFEGLNAKDLLEQAKSHKEGQKQTGIEILLSKLENPREKKDKLVEKPAAKPKEDKSDQKDGKKEAPTAKPKKSKK